jgi:hypothetical protein
MFSKEFEECARECVRLAGRAGSPKLRDELLEMAREWIQASVGDQPLPRKADVIH